MNTLPLSRVLLNRRGPEVPKTTPRFDDSLGGLAGFMTVMKRYRSSRGKSRMEQSPEEPEPRLLESSPRKSTRGARSPPSVSNVANQLKLLRDFTPRVFTWGLFTQALLSGMYPNSRLPEGKQGFCFTVLSVQTA